MSAFHSVPDPGTIESAVDAIDRYVGFKLTRLSKMKQEATRYVKLKHCRGRAMM